jgi:hypothetical protein
MSKSHEPHDQNKTPHEEIALRLRRDDFERYLRI